MTTKTIVADSSVIIKWLNNINENFVEIADKILKDASREDITLITPELAKYEIGNVLLYGKKLSIDQSNKIFDLLYGYPINFIAEDKDLSRSSYEIASKLKMTYYDASFLALAKFYDATLVTDNIKHHGKATDIKVIALKDYISP